MPADPDARQVPGWSVVDDEAQQLGMALPAYLEWAATAPGARWLTLLRLKWHVLAAVRRRDQAAHDAAAVDARWHAQGWRGGRTAPAGRARGVSDAA